MEDSRRMTLDGFINNNSGSFANATVKRHLARSRLKPRTVSVDIYFCHVCSLCQGINDEEDLPASFLESIYNDIKTTEIKKDRDPFTLGGQPAYDVESP